MKEIKMEIIISKDIKFSKTQTIFGEKIANRIILDEIRLKYKGLLNII